jgi:hypothetical protein
MTRPTLDAWRDFGGDYEYARAPFLEFQEGINAQGCAAFKAAHPDLPLTEKNSQALIHWCELERVPMTRKNLEVAWRELQADGALESKPVEQEAIGNLYTKEIEIRPVEAAQVAEPTPQERKTLEATRDDSSLSDHTRKRRLAELKKAATASRLANRSHDPNKTNRRVLIS